ncbi:MAG: hypothetical protein KKC26_03235 [Nanoarchaeota archaeon]|nr:hypothetical protein [Nanoarchaeota archaeon]
MEYNIYDEILLRHKNGEFVKGQIDRITSVDGKKFYLKGNERPYYPFQFIEAVEITNEMTIIVNEPVGVRV